MPLHPVLHDLARSLVLPLAACVLATASAEAQGGYRTQEFEQFGLELKIPRDYKAMPVDPTERWVALRWIDEDTAEEIAEDRDLPLSRVFAPELSVVWIDFVADPVRTGEGADEPVTDPESLPINSFERYVERVLRRGDEPIYRLSAAEDLGRRDRDQVTRYTLHPTGNDVPAWATVFRGPRRTLVMLGRCTKDVWQDQVKIWESMAKSAELTNPEPPDMSKWERYYEKNPDFVDPQFRLEVRSKLVRGWDARDTENYIFVFSTKDEPLMRDLERKLEAIRAELERNYPPEQPIEAVSIVRICRDRDEYMQYGGMPGSGGYWNSRAGELVFFDYKEDQEKAGEGVANSRIVLLHEAFHQYIYYCAGEVPPHSWFNEGTGDFYSGALIKGSKVLKIDTNPWRLGLIKQVVEDYPERVIPFAQIMAFEQPAFYQPNRIGICYAQAWSMIYFLRTSKVVEKNERWSQILPLYFDALKREYRARIAELDEDADAGERYNAGREARAAALEVAIEGVDLYALENEWRQFVLEM